ncbi:hypoxanthine-guanine phosphoribosyltransferase [Brettanomyces nanus]|uniref:Hypoxanthine-guanine phosphoribosyltransferase n=1 Tax=Eeniella nana TaxID=13502 RepID=A0A875RWN9_EENNA|nr:hypoxanthine-guanine phosphoribosyltransferase [Brettanomyces nanus]QPG76407.1 hypoxanthine-guanine phosphoribosyltransferase [Brettanomyces nanus]
MRYKKPFSKMTEETKKLFISYNHVHQLCKEAADKIRKLDIDYIIAIGGGGFIPARILRTFLKEPGKPSKRIFAIILSLYEDANTVSTTVEEVGSKVKRIQWINYGDSGIDLINKKVLIIDEVDDTRTTLHYALNELQGDAQEQARRMGLKDSNTEFFIYVLHNKLKPKKADLPASIMDGKHYIASRDVPDCWIAYPWESNDIAYQQKMAEEQGNDI